MRGGLLAITILLVREACAGACSGALDCNVRECEDCRCENGHCACADGWSGSACQTPYCANRTQCSGHGNCEQGVHNITCECDAGYDGPRCSARKCNLACLHGSTPNKNCTRCRGCMGAWTGPLCSIYNHSVPVSELLATMQLNFLAAQKQLNSTLPQHPLCFFGQECVGWGIDIFDGRVAQSTLVELTVDPDDPSRRWGGYLAPQEVDFEPFVKPEPNFQDGAGAFPLPSDLVSFVNQRVGVNDGLRGIYSSSWEDIFGLYYNDTKDKALSVVQAQIGLYKMTLLQGAARPPLGRHFAATVQSLPYNYSTPDEQMLWNRFFELYGTSMVVTSISGGLLEQRSRWASPLSARLDKNHLLENARIDFTRSTGLGGHGGELDPAYAAQRTFVGQGGQPFWCYGGDPSACAESIPKWQSTLEASPVLLTYGTMPISQLLAESAATKGDLKLQTSMAAAVQKNIAMRTRQWEAVDKCPPSCNGRGHCTKPAEACTCTQTPPPKGSSCVTGDPFVGRMCSGGSGRIVGGTRPVQLSMTGQKAETHMLPCVNGSGGYINGVCSTDATGHVQVFTYMGRPCYGPWSKGINQGATSSIILKGGHHHIYTCTFL